MKKLMKLLSLFLFLGVVLILSNTKSFAAEIQYTDNLIPNMTSNTAPSGKASASDIYDGTHDAWKAFDGKNAKEDDAWVVYGRTGWLEYDFLESKIITKYTIVPRAGANVHLLQSPKDFTFEAWDQEKNTWIILDTKLNITDWALDVKKEFTFINTKSYMKYRINVSSSNGYDDVTIGELEMMETVDTSNIKNLTAIAGKTSVQLTWDAVENATSYNIKRSEAAGGPYVTTYATSNTNSFTDTNATKGITYYYVISAVVSGAELTNSKEVYAKIGESSSANSLKVVVEVNEKLQLSVNDDLATNADMIWTTSDSAIATVDANGIVTGLKAGNAVITVKNADGTYTDKVKILVIESETEVAIDLKVGETRRLTIDDLAGTTSATWTSDDQAIATVSSTGKVTAVAQGTTYVIVKDDQGNEIGKICVRVRN